MLARDTPSCISCIRGAIDTVGNRAQRNPLAVTGDDIHSRVLSVKRGGLGFEHDSVHFEKVESSPVNAGLMCACDSRGPRAAVCLYLGGTALLSSVTCIQAHLGWVGAGS